MRKLMWKEWHEQNWKLIFGCIVLATLAFIGLRSRIVPDETIVLSVCLLGFTMLPILSSTGLIPAERSDGTLEALLALPVTPRQIMAVKTAMGLLQCSGPLALAAIVSVAVAGDREMTVSSIIMLYSRSILTGLSLFMWMQTLTIRLPSEARAAMLAIGVLMIWLMVSMGLAEAQFPIASSLSPFSFVLHITDSHIAAPPLAVATVMQVVISAALWFWASRTLGQKP